ncbi:MAG: hypothetical protein KGJ86_20370 [Chloroflexota bacterium]|nr:hypothetical protein [Chloroflexota bacterium]
MRFLIPIAVELDDGQLDLWATAIFLPRDGDKLSAETAEYGMRSQILARVVAEFKALGVRARVTIAGAPA